MVHVLISVVFPESKFSPILTSRSANNVYFCQHENRTCSCLLSLQTFMFLNVLNVGNLLHLNKCLTKVSCSSLRTNGKYLAQGDAPNLCYAVVKRFGSVSHLVFKLVPKRKKHFFFRRIHYHCNSTALFQLDNLALCGDVHPNPGFGNTSEHS